MNFAELPRCPGRCDQGCHPGRPLPGQALNHDLENFSALRRGSVTLLSAPAAVWHREFVTYTWAEHPISDLLGRLCEYSR
jgi:hypothetical protein